MRKLPSKPRSKILRKFLRSERITCIGVVVVLAVALVPSTARADAVINGRLVGGKIFQEFDENRLLGFNYGVPITDELVASRGGRFQVFSNNASIYWHPLVTNGHANTVGGSIRDRWRDSGWENGPLRYPTSREITLSNGAFSNFEGGSIYWSPATGSKIVWGAIRSHWWAAGAENFIGYPTSEELPVGRSNGIRQVFERGSVYWSQSSGAHIVGGAIGQIWANAGYEAASYGYPVTDEFDIPGGRRQIFQGGPIDWFSDGRPVGLIKMSSFRWQDYIPEEALTTRCDIAFVNQTVVSETYNGNNRSWDPEGSFKVRSDANVYVNQAKGGIKEVQFFRDTEPTVQTVRLVKVLPPGVSTQVTTLKAGPERIFQSALPRRTGDYPDVVRFRVDSLATNPFCDAPAIDDGIRAVFDAGFSASTGAFWMSGDRRRMPNAEAYIRDWVNPSNGGWKTVNQWVKDGPLCLLNDSNCGGRQRVDSASPNWNDGAVS